MSVMCLCVDCGVSITPLRGVVGRLFLRDNFKREHRNHTLIYQGMPDYAHYRYKKEELR